jgi:peroxin-16
MSSIKSIRDTIPNALNLYSDFILKNQSAVTQIESTLRSLTYIIPGRFRDAELASESLHSSIQLLSLYHDTLLSRALSKLPGMPRQNAHNRYTKFWVKGNKMYRRIAMLLSMIQYTELLWEMTAKRKGERVRWRVVVIIEFVKAICKLLLLRITKGRPLVTPPLPEREVIPESPAQLEDDDIPPWLDTDDTSAMRKEEEKMRRARQAKEYKMKRTGLTLPNLPNSSDISNYLLSKVLTADDIKAPITLLNTISGSAQYAEYMHILQPVIYAAALSYYRHDPKSWKPWLIGISIEYAARQLRTESVRTTALEKEQWNKRGWAMGWWALRGGFYENVTKGFLHRTSERLPSLLGGVVDDYLYLWDGYYFSTSQD